MKMWESFSRALEAHHRARKMAADARISEAIVPNAEWEGKVQGMVQRIQARYNETAAKYPGKNIYPIILPSPGDDPAIFNEAMRRIKQENLGKFYGGRSMLLA